MSEQEVDEYLAALDGAKRSALEELRRTILEIIPDAGQGIAYGSAGIQGWGQTSGRFRGVQDHLSYFPHSGSVLSELSDDVAPYATSKGALQFAVDAPLPKGLVKKLIAARMKELSQP